MIRKRPYRGSYIHRRNSFLDQQITIGDILKYGGLSLLVILVIVTIFMIPYKMGQASVVCDPLETKSGSESATIESKTVDDEPEKAEEIDAVPVEETPEETANETEEVVEEEPADEEAELIDDSSHYFESYSKVVLDMGDVNYEIRGADWGTINQIEVKIQNGEIATVRPTMLFVKIYDKGDSPEDWWDDEIELDPIAVGTGKTFEEFIDVHISFSDISRDKNIVLELRDEHDKRIATKTKQVKLD